MLILFWLSKMNKGGKKITLIAIAMGNFSKLFYTTKNNFAVFFRFSI